MSRLDINHISVIIDSNASLHRTGFPGVLCCKNLTHLFEGLPGGFDEEKIYDDQLDTDPSNVHDVQLPADLFNAYGNTKSINDEKTSTVSL